MGGHNHVGEKNPNAKLTVHQVDMIRVFLSGGVSVRKIACAVGVSKSTIGLIRQGKTWPDRLDSENDRDTEARDEANSDNRTK